MRLIFAFPTTVLNVTVVFFSFFSLILTQKCWCISMNHYDRERYFSLLKWIQKKTNPEGSAHQLQRKAWSEVVVGGCPWQSVDFWADKQSWWEHLSCWWELAVTAKSGYSQGRKEKKIKKVEIQGSMLLLFKTNTLQPQHEACHSDWFITAKLWWLRCRAEVNQTGCNSKYKLQKTRISSFNNGSCLPFPAWKRVDQSL